MTSSIFLGCNKTDSLDIDAINANEAKVLIDQDNKESILKMMKYVKNDVELRSGDSDEPIDGTGYRVYMQVFCSGTGGNCLPDLIVKPVIQSPNEDSDSEEIFNATEIGRILSSNVNNGSLSLTVNKNSETKTTFLIYSNPINPEKRMVIPLVQKP